MGKASITINVGALWNGSSELNKVNTDLRTMAARVAALDKSTTQSLALSGQSWENLGTKIYNAGSKIYSVGDALTNGVTVPMTTVGHYCVQQAMTFDTALADLNKTADLTETELQEFGQAALEASKTSPVTAAETLEAEALGAQLGISTDYLKDFADTANGLDIATSMDMETAATQMAQFANITGMADSETSNYGSTIVDLGNHLATTEGDISNMALRLAGTSTAAKLSSADILGMAGAMSSLGIKAEAGGSAMTTIISNISTAVANGGDLVQTYADVCGMSADEFSEKWKNEPIEALEMMVEGAGNLVDSGEDVTTILQSLGIEGIRQTDVMRRLIGQSDTLRNAVDRANTAWEENTALSTEVDKRNESLESRFETLQNKVNAAATEIGVPLAEALLDVADDLEPLISGVSDACEAFADMDSDSQKTALALAGVAVAAGPVLKVAGTLTQGVGNVVTALGKVQTQAAIFGDAMNTVDGASMRVYASTDSAATKLGLAGNKAAEAAGGADKYVAAWTKMTDAAKTVATSQDKINTLTEKAATASDNAKAKIETQVAALEKQSTAAQKVYTEQGKLVSAYSGSTSEAEKAAKTAESATKSYSSAGSSCSKLGAALGDIADGYQDVAVEGSETVSTTERISNGLKTAGSNAESFGTNIAGMIGQFVKANAAAIAVTALTAAVGYLVAKWQEAKQHEELLADATQDVSGILSTAASSADGYSASLGNVTADVDSVLQSQKEFNESLSSMFTETSQKSALLDQYVSTIEQLGNKSGLTASEQYKLKDAVDGYNEVCGTSYSVTDAANGVISDANGTIVENTKALRDNAEAWKTQAVAEAYSEKYTEAVKNQIDAQSELTKAQAELENKTNEYNAAQEKANKTIEAGGELDAYTSLRLLEMKDAVDKAEQKVDDCQKSVDSYGDSINELGTRASIAAAGLNQSLTEAIAQQEGTFTEMGQKIADSLGAGITAGTTTVETATEFMNSGVVSKVSTLSESTQPYGQILAQRLAAGIGEGSVSVEEATEAMNVLAQKGVTGLSEYYSSKGWELPDSFAAAITANSSEVTTSTDNMKMLTVAALSSGDATAAAQLYGGEIPSELASAIDANNSLPEGSVSSLVSLLAIKLTNGDAEAAAKLCGGNIDEGLAEGIENGTLSESAAQYLGEDVIEKMRDSLGVHSPSTYAIEAGGYIDEGLTQGIQNNQQGPLDAVTQLGTSIVGGLANLGTDFLTKGSEAVNSLISGLGLNVEGVSSASSSLAGAAESGTSGTAATLGSQGSSASSEFASGVGSAVGSAGSNAGSLFSAASSGTSGTAATLGGYGRSASSEFASGIASGVGSTRSSASSLNSAAQGARVTGSYGWGSDLASNFASGIRAGIGWVSSAATAIANAAKSILHFSAPDKGPWSGAEKGGVRSGLHLAQNFAEGMRLGISDVEASSLALSAAMEPSLPALPSMPVPALVGASTAGAGQSVQVTNNNVYINGAQVNNLSNRAQDLLGELFNEFSTVARMG